MEVLASYRLVSKKVDSAIRVQIPLEAVRISYRVYIPGKGMNKTILHPAQ